MGTPLRSTCALQRLTAPGILLHLPTTQRQFLALTLPSWRCHVVSDGDLADWTMLTLPGLVICNITNWKITIEIVDLPDLPIEKS